MTASLVDVIACQRVGLISISDLLAAFLDLATQRLRLSLIPGDVQWVFLS
jgi:hypothetical protein